MGGGVSGILPGFSQLRGWEMVFVREVKKHKITSHFFKVTHLIWAIEGQNNESYRGVGPSKKEEKFPFFEKFPLFEKFPT